MVMGMANLAMATGNIGREGVGVNPLRGQNNVQGSCDMGSFPHELPGYRHVSDDAVRADLREPVGHDAPAPSPACGSRTCSTPRSTAPSGGCTSRARTSRSPTPTPSTSPPRCGAMELVVVQDLFLNETAQVRPRVPARHVVPGEGRHLHQRRAPDQPGPPGDGAEERQARVGDRLRDRHGDGLPDARTTTPSQIMDEIAAITPTFAGVSFEKLDEVGSMQWPCNDDAPDGTPIMHVEAFARGKGRFVPTPFVPTDERSTRSFPLILTTGRILQPVQRRRADPAHGQHRLAPGGHARDPPARRRGARHHTTATRSTLASRVGRDDAARARSPTGCRPASSTRRSTTRSPAPTS